MLFIGSSSESLGAAYAVQQNLQDVSQPVVWTQGIFEVASSTIESLLDALNEMNYSVFVFAADDLARIRSDADISIVRDNVIFELGLFVGRLGRERCFVIKPEKADLHIPSDLLGVTLATYKKPDNERYLQAALGPACHQVRNRIISTRPRSETAVDLGDADFTQLVSLAIPEGERRHLINLANGTTSKYAGRGSLRDELRHLRALGLVRNRGDTHMAALKTGLEFDLATYVELTGPGKELTAKLRT